MSKSINPADFYHLRDYLRACEVQAAADAGHSTRRHIWKNCFEIDGLDFFYPNLPITKADGKVYAELRVSGIENANGHTLHNLWIDVPASATGRVSPAECVGYARAAVNVEAEEAA